MSSYSHFFSKTFQHICVSLDVNFNESLTDDIVSFEQLGPGHLGQMCIDLCLLPGVNVQRLSSHAGAQSLEENGFNSCNAE